MLPRLTALLAALLIPALAAAQGVERSDAVRLLRQATFGPTEAEIERVMAVGPAAWIDAQLALPVGAYPAYPYVPAVRPQTCVDERTPPITATSFCARDNYTIFQLQLAFFRDAIGAPDQLRQRLANPTPAYVARVSAVFADDGAGRRGNLAAVVRAILLDPEARGARSHESNFGKLDEPILYLGSMVRGLGGRSDGVYLRFAAAALSQPVFAAPSVFNFYPAGYRIAGGLSAPEFGIQTTATAINRTNIAYGLIFSNGIAPDPMVFGATGTAVNLAPYQAVAGDAATLVSRLEANLLAVPLPAAARSAVIAAVNAVPASDRLNRARTAAYLIVTSPHFQVER